MFLSSQTITIIVLLTLVGGYLASVLADFLNLGCLDPKLPPQFKGVYDNERYAKSQSYVRATTRFGLVCTSFDLFCLLIFWFAGGFGILDTLIRSLGQGPIISGLLFIGSLAVMKSIVSLPFGIYSTFVIEERFGFNKTTPGVFLADLVKSFFLSALLGGTLLGLIIWFFEISGPMAWLYCWAASTFFLLAVQYIVPTWIMPLFNTFTPLEEGPLKKAIFNYARGIDFSLSNIYVMDGSKRSAKSNAFFTGFGKNKRIVLFDTLIKEQSVEELVAILAHEMGHFKKKHIIRRMALGIAQMGVIFFLISVFISRESLFHAFYVDQVSIHCGLIFFAILFSPINLVLSLALQVSSRRDEYEADRFAALTTGQAGFLVSALKKLTAANLSNLTPHPFYVFLNYSHPPVMERISALGRIHDKGR